MNIMMRVTFPSSLLIHALETTPPEACAGLVLSPAMMLV
jgi:hypothetical protein